MRVALVTAPIHAMMLCSLAHYPPSLSVVFESA